MRLIALSICLAALGTAVGVAQPYPTIVGEWHTDGAPDDCGTQWSLHIAPMDMSGGELSCSFNSVTRDQWMVTWIGECGNVDFEPAKVVAVENDITGALTLSWSNTGASEVLQRCTPR